MRENDRDATARDLARPPVELCGAIHQRAGEGKGGAAEAPAAGDRPASLTGHLLRIAGTGAGRAFGSRRSRAARPRRCDRLYSRAGSPTFRDVAEGEGVPSSAMSGEAPSVSSQALPIRVTTGNLGANSPGWRAVRFDETAFSPMAFSGKICR